MLETLYDKTSEIAYFYGKPIQEIDPKKVREYLEKYYREQSEEEDRRAKFLYECKETFERKLKLENSRIIAFVLSLALIVLILIVGGIK